MSKTDCQTDMDGLPFSLATLFPGESLSNDVAEALNQALVEPARNIASRPSKKVRARLVEFGYLCGLEDRSPGKKDQEILRTLYQVIELLHAGSLIVDDFQDQSEFRRGQKSIHLQYGASMAINTANWLYFWPLRLIRNSSLTESSRRIAIDLYTQTVELAHMGQALDLSINAEHLNETNVHRLVNHSIEGKSGLLGGMATALGCLTSNPDQWQLVQSLGRRIGILLQKYDDLGNLCNSANGPKQFEDILSGKPSWIWCLAESIGCFSEFQVLARDARASKDIDPLTQWVASTEFGKKGKTILRTEAKGIIADAPRENGSTLLTSLLGKLDDAYV